MSLAINEYMGVLQSHNCSVGLAHSSTFFVFRSNKTSKQFMYVVVKLVQFISLSNDLGDSGLSSQHWLIGTYHRVGGFRLGHAIQSCVDIKSNL